MTMSKTPGDDDASFVRDLVNALSAAAPQDVFDIGARRMADLGFDWLAVGVARADTYELVRYRTTIPADVHVSFQSVVTRQDRRGDYIYEHCRTSVAPLWDRPDPAMREDAYEQTMAALLASLGVRVLLAVPLQMTGLVGGVSAYALGADAPERFETPSRRGRAETAARLIGSFYDAMSDEAGFTLPERVHGPKVRLSARQREALQLLAEGHQLARIAHEMGVAEAMARRHIASARDRLGARTREQALALAIRHRLL
jgi:DNA-binding CsgD family transcriptional regulator